MQKKSFVLGTVILMLSNFAVRALGFVYRVFLSNKLGAEGMGIFQLIMPIYSLIILTLTSGISIGVSKMAAEEMAHNNRTNVRRITAYSAALTIMAGALVSCFLYININYVASNILHDERTYLSLLILVPTIPIIAAASAVRGYFYGTQQVMAPAISQIAEQAVKMVIVMALASVFIPKGLEYACALATLGMVAGEIINLAVLMPIYFLKNKNIKKGHREKRISRRRTILSKLIKIAIPVSANRFVVSALSSIEHIAIPSMLVIGGLDYSSSMETFGKLSGMALPLILFPSLVTGSLATTLVPAISESSTLGRYRAVNIRIEKSIRLSIILGVIFTVVFIACPNEISDFIYPSQNAGFLLKALSYSCVFIYLQQTLTGIMNGLGQQGALLRNTLVGSFIRIAAVFILIPIYGIKSYTWGIVASYIITVALNLLSMNKVTGLVIDIRKWVIKPGLASVLMILCYGIVKDILDSVLMLTAITGAFFSLAISLLAGILIMHILGVFRFEEYLNILNFKK